ncbi:MAG: hypothetical protein R6V50_03780 [Thermoplasmatota archaeon]
MKKLFLVIGICTLLVCMPMITAAPSLGLINSGLQRRTLPAGDGTFEGVFAEKNETGYVVLGDINGTYSKGPGPFGSFDGVWNMLDDSANGTFSGYIVSRFIMGQYEVNNSQETGNFIGLLNVNQSAMEFTAIALVFTDDGLLVRYAAGDIIEE